MDGGATDRGDPLALSGVSLTLNDRLPYGLFIVAEERDSPRAMATRAARRQVIAEQVA
jgi:hypothetical protein